MRRRARSSGSGWLAVAPSRLSSGVHILAPEPAVAAGSAVHGQSSPVGPLPQRGLVHVQGAANLAKGHPARGIFGVGRHLKSVEICKNRLAAQV